MENLFLIKSEILMLLVSFLYCLYFFIDKLFEKYISFKKIINPVKKSKINSININIGDKKYKKVKKKSFSLSMDQKEKLSNIIKRVKNNISKGYYDVARNLIVEGLALDKYNKDLNIELARIYEQEKKYKNAEYIYNEIIENIKDATSVIKKLGFVLAAQKKYKKSIKSFEKVHKRDKSDTEVIDMLSDLNYEIGNYEASIKYIIISLKDTPRNANKLMLAGNAYEKIREYSHAIDYYNKVLQIQPYNTEIIEKVKILKK